jgi:hypothetical protein
MKKYFLAVIVLSISGYCFAQVGSNESSKNNLPSSNNKRELLFSGPDIKLYPNPAKNKITLQVKGFVPGMVTVKIIDSIGKLLRQDSRLLITGAEEVPMFLALQQGFYNIEVDQKGKFVKKKLVIL